MPSPPRDRLDRTVSSTTSLAVIGPGRVGWAMFDAVSTLAGWTVSEPLGRHSDRAPLAAVDLVLLTVPDRFLPAVAATVPLGPVVAHVSGASGLEVLDPHRRRGSAHPLMTLPDRRIGARRLLDRCPFAVSGDPLVGRLVDDLGGEKFAIAEADRALYHATAVVCSNHVVTLLAQAERLANRLGVDPGLFHPLTRAAIADVERIGARAALTGPAVRGDWTTITRHLEELPDSERPLYVALAQAAAELGDQHFPLGPVAPVDRRRSTVGDDADGAGPTPLR